MLGKALGDRALAVDGDAGVEEAALGEMREDLA